MKGRFFFTILTAFIFYIWTSSGFAEVINLAGELSIEQGVICQDIVNRVPVGTGDIFPKEVPKLFCFTKVLGAQTPTTITHIWYQNGILQSKVKLDVKSASWRTWSSMEMSAKKVGEWMVEIVSEDGVALESIIFIVR